MAGCLRTHQKLFVVFFLLCIMVVVVTGNSKEAYSFESHSCGHKHNADQVSSLTFTTLLAYSAEDKLLTFFLIFQENKF